MAHLRGKLKWEDQNMDEFEPRAAAETPLDRLSVDELEARIRTLQAEIELCRAEIDRKMAQRSKADKLFGGEG